MASTIDESIKATIMRDLLAILRKIRLVAMPFLGAQPTENELRDWDLWGPLVLCLMLAFILITHHNSLGTSGLFVLVFCIVTVGSAVVTLNAKFLGGKISFFQTLCILGYCLFPVVLCGGILLTPINSRNLWPIKIILCGIAWYWACWASLGFVSSAVAAKRRLLALYPVALFYFFLVWLLAVTL